MSNNKNNKPKNKTHKGSKHNAAKARVRANPIKMVKSDYLYAASILDPFRFRNVKIPDSNTWPSFSTSIKGSITVSAVAGLGSSSGTNAAGFLLYLEGLGSASPLKRLIVAGSGNGWRYNAIGETTPGIPIIKAAAASTRIVSASIACFPTMSFMNNQGSMYMASIPVDVDVPANFDFFSAFEASSFSTLNTSRKCPIAMGHACAVNYYPASPLSYRYIPETSGASTGALAVFCPGMALGATFEVSYVINYECIPKPSAFVLTKINASPCSYGALEIAANALGAEKLYATFEQDIFMSMTTVTEAIEPENDSFFSRIANYLSTHARNTSLEDFISYMNMGKAVGTMVSGAMGYSGGVGPAAIMEDPPSRPLDPTIAPVIPPPNKALNLTWLKLFNRFIKKSLKYGENHLYTYKSNYPLSIIPLKQRFAHDLFVAFSRYASRVHYHDQNLAARSGQPTTISINSFRTGLFSEICRQIVTLGYYSYSSSSKTVVFNCNFLLRQGSEMVPRVQRIDLFDEDLISPGDDVSVTVELLV